MKATDIKPNLFKRLFNLRLRWKILIALVLALISLLVAAEVLSRVCPQIVRTEYPDCSYLEEAFGPHKELNDLLPVIPPNTDPVEWTAANRIVYVPREDMKGLNGIACGLHGFVSNDLPGVAKTYVATHESIHLLGVSDETRTNYLAGARHPFGLALTVIYSTVHGFAAQPISQYPCTLGSLWRTFKIYFLGGSF